MAYLIYKITDHFNKKYYVGQTTRSIDIRFKEHKRNKISYIGRAIHKYSKKFFTIEILEECETAEQLNERERYWIAKLNCRWPNGYNNSVGGEGNWERTSESIEKMSRKGTHQTEKTRKQISLSLTGEKNPQYGKPKSDETKAKLSAAAKNKRAVLCVEQNQIYDSMSMAARINNLHVQDISRACKNPHRTAGKCHWRYV